MKHHIPGADAQLEVTWDKNGIAHIFATSVADAYRGMGYAAGSERLWQIHLSTAYAQGEAAALLGERFVGQDALQRACNVDGKQTGLPDSDGDWVVDAYLEGLNAWVRGLPEVPPEFLRAGATPREYTRADVAARYRFTSWFQHKSWTEKMVLGRLMATHGVDWFRHHVLHFSDDDAGQIERHADALRTLSMAPLALAYPVNVPASLSGSNNWAIRGNLSASGKPMLATDPHQPHTIPNTFFYAHLHAGDWDAFGAAFPGVPYFMMGYTRHIAWGLTTGFVDSYDIYVEQVRGEQYRGPQDWQDLDTRTLGIAVKDAPERNLTVRHTAHGVLLESLAESLGLTGAGGEYQTALRWSLAQVPTSAGALARLPLAKTTREFGDLLFENDVCPLVNNIIAVDSDDNLERFMATTLPVRSGVTGTVPLTGWDPAHDFRLSRASELKIERNPPSGFAFTANNDTMGDSGDFPIHNFPTHSARADRIKAHLQASNLFTTDDFKHMQLDLTDLRARETLTDLLPVLAESSDPRVQLAQKILSAWDHVASADSAAPCLFYPFQDQMWPFRFLREVLEDDLLKVLPAGAPGLGRFDIRSFMREDNPFHAHRAVMIDTIHKVMGTVVDRVSKSLGDDPAAWRWGNLHQISFSHTLAKEAPWTGMRAGPDPIGGSPTTLGMAVHMGPGPGADTDDIPCRVYHGPAYRLVVDLADPDHASLVIAGGNGGRPDSPFVTNQYKQWLSGNYYSLNLQRDEIPVAETWNIHP